MNFKTIGLVFGLLTALFSSSGQNMYVGDTSAETETDTLTRGNYSTELVPYSWDDTTAFDGKRSVRVDWDQKTRRRTTDTSPGIVTCVDKYISVASTPDLKIGETYTFSFYAKASDDNYPISLSMTPSYWEFHVADCAKDITLSREWKRYSFTFVPQVKPQATVKSYSAFLDFSKSPVGKVWYDAVQIEKGETPSPYKNSSQMNVGVALNSTNWSNIYFPQDPVTATIRVDMPSDKAELQCQVVDYQGKVVKDFKQSVTGSNEIKLPLDSQQLGWFKVTAMLSFNGKTMSSHSVNYIKIAKPVDIAPGIQPFSGLINGYGWDHFEIMRKIGVKRVEVTVSWGTRSWVGGIEMAPGKFDWTVVEWQLKRGKEFGMLNKLIANPFDVPDWYLDKEELAKANMTNSLLVLGSERHEDWRKFIGELTRRYGNMIDEFELGAEDNGRLGINQYYKALYPKEVKEGVLCGGKPFDDLCAMVKIGAAEIRKTQPDMKIGAIRPSLIGGGHTLFIREMFKIIGKDINVFPVDFYMFPYDFGPLMQQRRSKSDALIESYNEARKITQELGSNQPIYMSEFGWFPDTRFPDDSIYRQEQAETMAKDFIAARIAGYFAFDWFQGFSGIGVPQYTSLMQQNMKIQSIAASYSAVAQVVENVTESKWLTPDRVTRIAIMKKNNGKGVAAVWSDKSYKLSLPSDSGMTVTDLMGNTLQSAEGQFALSPAPIYIWHNDFKQLSEILAKADVEMTEFCDIRFRMVSENVGLLQFANLSNTVSLEINAEITVNGKTISKTVDVPKGSDNMCDIPLSGKSVKVKAKTSTGKSVMERSFDLDVPIPIVAGSEATGVIAKAELRSDIYPPADPWVPWSGSDDLSLKITSAWDADNLYLEVKVKDDLHFNKFPESPWNGDSLQIAIDPKNDGAFYVPAEGKKLGPDDFEFGLALNDDGKSRCVSSFGKSICQSDNYTIVRDEKEKTTTYELRLLWKDLGVKPHSGMIFGMSFVVFDDDTGTGQNYYAPVGGGIAGGKNPALYKKFVLK